MHTNRLSSEKSPYLLQHAHNPVDWYPWGPDAFEKARSEDKPIFLSVGYSTCHWCHVMERESFEREDTAEILNRFFVPVKVDREERPDVDRVYMTFVQATTGSGGWPMSVWLTPDLQPFYGGTYFPPDSRWGRPGFRQVLEQLAMAWRDDRPRILEAGNSVVDQLKKLVDVSGTGVIDNGVLDSGFYSFRRAFDSRLGGFGGAPKFPRPSSLNFLLRYGLLDNNDEALQMVFTTLREMARGGMNDQLGGGFHRYSVDARWFVPHFEKMLYDQAQLAVSYLEAFQISGDDTFARTARNVFEYVLRDMTHCDGGFYSAEDADSAADPEKPHEKGEGAFYIWDHDEIAHIADARTAEIFAWRYGVEPGGNVSEDPHGEFTGRNILYQRFTLAETAQRFGISETEAESIFENVRLRLMEVRASRVRPHLDDKILTAWNGLMISAFAKGYSVLGDKAYLAAAERGAQFILRHMYFDKMLLRRWRDGEAAVGGFLDDYAFFAQALLDLYEASFDNNYLYTALDLTLRMRELFEDEQHGGFFSATTADQSVILRFKEDHDGAEPSGNSIAILNLLRLAAITGRADLNASAERALSAFAAKAAAGPTSLPQLLVAAMHQLTPPRQIVLAGPRNALDALRRVIYAKFLPFHSVLWAGSHSVNAELLAMGDAHSRPTAYVCENFQCQLPVTEPEKLAELLQ